MRSAGITSSNGCCDTEMGISEEELSIGPAHDSSIITYVEGGRREVGSVDISQPNESETKNSNGYTIDHEEPIAPHFPPKRKAKLHACTHCDYKSDHLSHFKRHLRIHTTEKLFICNECEYQSSWPDYLLNQ